VTRPTQYSYCPLCEACCGLEVEIADGKVGGVRGDARDPLSRGHICPKAAAIGDVIGDADRIRHPLRRVGERFEPVSWEIALAEIGARLAAIGREHGRDAVAFYYGNPTAHSYSAVLTGVLLRRALGSRNVYSANSVDALPRLLVSSLLYGNQALIPIPDIDRTDYLLLLGANPLVSNGSIMTAPGMARRLRALRERGGKLVVIDPRRTATAKVADEHFFIRPGTDALLLAAMARTILEQGLARPGRLAPVLDGMGELERLLAPFGPETVAPAVGLRASEIVRIATELARAPSAVCYGRLGTSAQAFGTLATWLVDVLNIVTGNLDRPGGAMFTTAAVDLVRLTRLLGEPGHFDRWRSRVGGLPELSGELPVAALAGEMETPGRGQVRALITYAGNPVLSVPNGRRLDRALSGLDLMVSVDIYLNETTRHAHFVLPSSFGFEHDAYPILFHSLAVRNTAHYVPALVERPVDTRHDWEILVGLVESLGRARGWVRRLDGLVQAALMRRMGPARLLDMLLRLGPRRLSLAQLRAAPHGIDLGPLEPRFPKRLQTHDRRVHLVHDVLRADLGRLVRSASGATQEGLLLIGRRELRSNNSWMHNCERLTRGPRRCVLTMHPDDATARALRDGQEVVLRSETGEITVPLSISDEVMRGVVSLPHGWGHDREGVRLGTAAASPGASMNDVVDDGVVDAISGVSVITGVPVEVVAR